MAFSAITVLIVALAADPVPELVPTDPVTIFVEEASDWLLEGRSLPRDYRLRLLAMTPADRMRAITYLRRVGLLTGAPWPVADLLRPSSGVTEVEQ
ncbi:MAG: hypothetical protein ACK4YU_12050 [Paracoccus sp. (in: a-proteobacteria)]